MISCAEDEVLDLVVLHATTAHEHEYTPELREQLRSIVTGEEGAASVTAPVWFAQKRTGALAFGAVRLSNLRSLSSPQQPLGLWIHRSPIESEYMLTASQKQFTARQNHLTSKSFIT